eukprot:scaffold166433_cov19-Prasinocladus_malaysianus.AAC.1
MAFSVETQSRASLTHDTCRFVSSGGWYLSSSETVHDSHKAWGQSINAALNSQAVAVCSNSMLAQAVCCSVFDHGTRPSTTGSAD